MNDPETSKLAAQSVNVNKRETQVLVALLDGPATTVEVSVSLGIDKWSISPRMVPLEEKGLVKRIGTKKAPSGVGGRESLQIVWGLTQTGTFKAQSLR